MFVVSIRCRCLEPPKAGGGRDDDYLGLQVWLWCLPGRWASFEGWIGYLVPHIGRVGYAERLAQGRSIGSGMIEGTIKTLGLRMKARGARWVERNAEHMAALVALSNSTLWETYWANAV